MEHRSSIAYKLMTQSFITILYDFGNNLKEIKPGFSRRVAPICYWQEKYFADHTTLRNTRLYILVLKENATKDVYLIGNRLWPEVSPN
jgi:hypothetical protein